MWLIIGKKFKILFISINSVWRYGNIGMDQLLGFLRKQGFNIEIGYFRSKESAKNIYMQIQRGYDLYAFSVNISNYSKCVKISEMIKEKEPYASIVFGGGYPTRYYREILKETDCADYLVLGDGEYPSLYLYDRLARVKEEKTKNIAIDHPSVASADNYRNKEGYFNSEITWEPAYDYYEKDDNFTNSRKVHCIQIKNNVCTGNCSFCTERHGKIVYKNINQVVDQIEYVYQNYKIEKVYFTDDNILDPNTQKAKQHLRELCIELQKRKMKLSYQCYIKAFSLKNTEEDHALLSLMRDTGFVEIFIGIEAGNQEDLDLYNKFTTVEDNYEIIKLLREHDIFPIMGYIAFNPYSTRDRIRQNFRFLCDIKCTYLHNYLYSFTVINKYTALYEMIKKDKLLLSDESKYVGVEFSFQNEEVKEVMEYVQDKMIPRLRKLDYELDWVTYSAMEHEVCHAENLIDYRPILEKQKEKDALWIKEHLGLLFEDFDVGAFENVEEDFWNYFENEEKLLKMIYEYYISLHYL